MKAGGVDPHCAAHLAVVVECRAGHFANLFEGSVAFVVEDKVLDGVVRDDQVDPPIAIEVDGCETQRLSEGKAGSLVFDLDSRCGGDVGEVTAAIVAIQVWVGAREHRQDRGH